MSLVVEMAHRQGDMDLSVQFRAPGGITALFGHSGSGKTTVVNAVAGLLRPRSGRVVLNDETLTDTDRGVFLPPHRRRLGYVFQDGRLFPHLTVRGNLTYGQRLAPPRAAGPGLDEVCDLLGIAALLDRRPAALSGGEKQRVAIGRALLSRPRMLLMDEPLAALDAARKDEILPFVERLRDETGLPVLYVSHAASEVARLADTVVVLERGRVVRSGPADQVLSDPAMVRHIGLRDAGAVLVATVARHHDDGLTELAAAGGRLFLPRMDGEPGTVTRVRILARDVMLARRPPEQISALNILAGQVVALREGEGPGMIVQVDCGGDRVLARITRRSAEALALAPGVPVHAVIKTVSVARADVGAGAPRARP